MLAVLLLTLLASACSPAPASSPDASASTATAPPPPVTPSAIPSTPVPSASVSKKPTSSPSPSSPSPSSSRKRSSSLAGDRRNQLAFAPVDDPSQITVEGRVSQTQAWSTSKVLVVAAYLATAVEGHPDRVSPRNRQLIEAALTRSDAAAVVAIRGQIRGRPGPAMTRVLRAIGDEETTAPDRSQGLMSWSAREQVRFMAALANGRVVSKAASAYLLRVMHPVRAHAWGLGTVGASAFKGGWLRADTVTRQMGLVDGYAVAIITDGVGPAVLQSDGDRAHVQQMNRLAALLRDRLEDERRRR